jgi:hypothetical protein
MSDPLPSKFEERIRNISDEELAFRGWTREGMRDAYRRRLEADQHSPQVGDEAPDFELERLDRTGKRSGGYLRLSSLRGRPVGLIFGSYT